jgi:uncharacterized delta-60 repeat protein
MISPGKRTLLVALALAASVLPAAHAAANAGELDPSFGVGGIATAVAYNGHPQDLATDRQGRIVVGGLWISPGGAHPLVNRFEPDGSLDPSFDFRGVSDFWCDLKGEISGVAIDSADRIVLTGRAADFNSMSPRLCVVRLLSDGKLDRSFSGDGKLTLETAGAATDVAIDREGRILVASDDGLTAIRLTDGGTLDPTFGEGGIASLHPGDASEAQAIAADSSGRVVLAGTARAPGSSAMAVARFGVDGQPDPTFAGSGLETLRFPGPTGLETATDLVLDRDGRLVLSGTDRLEGSELALAARLLPDGALDASFGGIGRVFLSLPGVAIGNGIAVDRSGRVLATGGIRVPRDNASVWEAFLARLAPDGAIDGSFGAGGVVRESSFSAAAGNGGAAVQVDSSGRYLVAAASLTNAISTGNFGVARFLPEAQAAPAPRYRCHGREATMVGTPGADVLRGTRRRDVIVSLGGDDRIRAFAGRDLVCAGGGRDSVRGGGGNDLLFGGPGRDRLFGQAGRDRLRGGPGRDLLVGGPGFDSPRR